MGPITDMAGRRRSSSGSYNPLADKSVEATGLETWTCVAETSVQLHEKPTLLSPEAGVCKVGQQIAAIKEGDWLKLKDTDRDLYLPYLDKNGNRLFKNERLSLMERATSGEPDDPMRTSSRNSLSSKGSHASSKKSGSSGDGITRRQSFRWVDNEGISHRLAGDSDVLKDTRVRPEVWICVAEQGVPYSTSPSYGDMCGKHCAVGTKVTAVKEDDWLKIIEVKESFDILSAAEMIGRRSLKSSTRVTLIEPGLYLPFMQEGQRLFKNEKVMLWEAAGQDGERAGSTPEKGGCALM